MHCASFIFIAPNFCRMRKYEKQTEVPYNFHFQLNVIRVCFTIKVNSETFWKLDFEFGAWQRNSFWVWRTVEKWFAHLCDSESTKAWFPQSKKTYQKSLLSFRPHVFKEACFLFDPNCSKKLAFFLILSIQNRLAFFSIPYFQKNVRSFRS